MNRLQPELNRLYLLDSCAPAAALFDGQDRVRALVMALTQPADWSLLSTVWRGVQAELDLPAPAIAVSGIDALQLWFSVAEPIDAAQAHAFLEALRARFLAGVAASRIRLAPAPGAAHGALVPAEQAGTGHWSAFVAPDLAAVFEETPWLDLPPGDEGQAALLRGLQTMKRPAFEAALARMAGDAASSDAGASGAHAPSPSGAPAAGADARHFLARIMNDETVALALRIEAAKALLPYADEGPPRSGR